MTKVGAPPEGSGDSLEVEFEEGFIDAWAMESERAFSREGGGFVESM